MEHKQSGRSKRVCFGDGGVIRGVLDREIGGSELEVIGGALGQKGTVGLGFWGGEAAQKLAQAASKGIRAWGGTVLYHDMECAAQGAWITRNYRLERSLFIEHTCGRVFLHIFDRDGLPLRREEEVEIEEFLRCPSDNTDIPMGGQGRIQVERSSYARDAVGRGALPRFRLHTVTAAVPGDSPADRALRRCLSLLGCTVVDHWRRGIPAFGAEYGGFCLSAQDERGTLLEPEQLLPMVCLIEMEQGSGKVAVPDGASAAVELVAAGFGGDCLRLGRDGEKARELYASQPWLRDAAFAAVRICSRMAITGERLEELMAKTPRFSVRKREVPLRADQHKVMHELARRHHRELSGDGLRVRTGNGWVYVAPMLRRHALRVVAESADMELAAELCDFYVGRAVRTDRALFRQDAQEGLEN